MNVPSEFENAWYILKYGEGFGGTLSRMDCFKKMVYEKNGANLWQFHQCWRELEKMPEKDIATLKKALATYGLYT